jgi:hypothetical protein
LYRKYWAEIVPFVEQACSSLQQLMNSSTLLVWKFGPGLPPCSERTSDWSWQPMALEQPELALRVLALALLEQSNQSHDQSE